MKHISRATLVAAPLALLATLPAHAAPGGGADRVRVNLVYKEGQRGNAARALSMVGAEVHHDFVALRGYTISLPAVALEGLSRNPAIEYVEVDPTRHLMAQEVPYGIAAVQASPALDGGAANTTVCIIDSGIDADHEDLEGNKLAGHTDTGAGGSWTAASPASWYTDENHHGTHVAGTVAALDNAVGVVGVAPGGQLNLYIVKVFGASGWAYSSTLVDALNRCVSGRVSDTNLIVSMSLGGSIKSRFEETAFNDAYNNKNVLSIAAAGNDGNSRNSYPASYSSVVSVAAVDETHAWATFSQYNSQVELAAPGVAVLSTVPEGSGTAASVSAGNLSPPAEAMDGSPRSSRTGGLFDCGLGTSACTGATGRVCLIERGTNSFSEKVLNCQAGGGVATIIFNNTDGVLLGTLGGAATSIPSVGIARADGLALRALGTPSTTVSVADSNYARFDGTSMATPHVSGVAALVWSRDKNCTNAQIRNVLAASALDLGATGRDVYFGHGLVQAMAAIDKLGSNCGGSASGGGGGGGGGKGGGKKP